MKKLFAFAPVLMLLACSGCGDSHDSLAKDSVSTMKKLIAVLDDVKDEASAKSHKSELKSLMEQLNSINERQAKLPVPTEAEQKDMESKYGKEMEQLIPKFQGHMMRIAFDPKIAAVLQDLDQTMKKIR